MICLGCTDLLQMAELEATLCRQHGADSFVQFGHGPFLQFVVDRKLASLGGHGTPSQEVQTVWKPSDSSPVHPFITVRSIVHPPCARMRLSMPHLCSHARHLFMLPAPLNIWLRAPPYMSSTPLYHVFNAPLACLEHPSYMSSMPLLTCLQCPPYTSSVPLSLICLQCPP